VSFAAWAGGGSVLLPRQPGKIRLSVFCLTNCLRGLHQDRIGGALRSAVSRRRAWGPPCGIDGLEGGPTGECVRFVPCWETFRLFDRALRGQTETRSRDRSLDAGCDHSAWQTHFLPAATGRRRPQPICARKAVAFFSHCLSDSPGNCYQVHKGSSGPSFSRPGDAGLPPSGSGE